MPVIQSVLRRFGYIKQDAPKPIIYDRYPNTPEVTVTDGSMTAGTDLSYNTAARTGYQTNADVMACISLIAQSGAQVKWDDSPWPERTQSGTTRPQQQGTGPAAALLEAAGGASYVQSLLSYLLLSGSSYTEITELGADRPGGRPRYRLDLLRPDRVSPVLSAPVTAQVRMVTGWLYSVNGHRRLIAPESMIQTKLFNPLNDYVGMSPMQAAMLDIQSKNAGTALTQRTYSRGFTSGVIEAAIGSNWGDNEIAVVRARAEDMQRTGRVLFLENATWKDIDFSLAAAGVVDNRLFSKRDVAAVFKVPPELIGDVNSKTYSNYQEARQALYTEAVIPLLKQVADDFNRQMRARLLSILALDKDSFDALAYVRREATDRVMKQFGGGVITHDEARAELLYGPVKEVPAGAGGIFYAPANVVPLGETDER